MEEKEEQTNVLYPETNKKGKQIYPSDYFPNNGETLVWSVDQSAVQKTTNKEKCKQQKKLDPLPKLSRTKFFPVAHLKSHSKFA